MIHVRGLTVVNTTLYVKERFGADAHAAVVAAVTPASAATFAATIREGAWKPLADVVAYMETARRLLAPEEAAFYREVGRHSGHIAGRSGFRFLLGSDPLTSLGRLGYMWGFLYDAGHTEVVSRSLTGAALRIHDFRVPSQSWCHRIAGFLEGCLELMDAREARVEETACVCQGEPYCEMTGHWS